jgi:amino acid transporter
MCMLDTIRAIPDELRSIVTMLFAFMVSNGLAPEMNPDAGPLHRAGQVGTVISVVVIAVTALIGVLVLSQINGALPEVQNQQLNDSSNAILEGFSGAMDLVPIVLLVLVASLVIGIVQRLRG